MKKFLSVGVMGFSGAKFDTQKAFQNLNQAFEVIGVLASPIMPIEIVSGLTDLGIPGMAYRLALSNGWKTVGIACAKANDYSCFPCNEVQIVGKRWGAESRRFIKRCDIFIRVGGGDQSFKEIAMAKALGKPVIEFDLERIVELVPKAS